MKRSSILWTMIAACALGLVVNEEAMAQRRGYRGGYYRGGGYYGRYYDGGRYYGGGYYGGYRGWYPYRYGLGFGSGYYPGYSYSYYPSYRYYYDPGYYDSTYVVPTVPAAPSSTYISTTTAEVEVRVPDPYAQVWFSGQQMQQTGTNRLFVTPPLDPGTNYTYEVRATWNQGGQSRTVDRTVNVTAGAHVIVDFTTQ